MQKAEAELQVAEAQKQEAAREPRRSPRPRPRSPTKIVREHTILAPFTGIITDKIKNQGEAVRANEAVVRVGRTDKLRFLGYLPLASAPRVQVGDSVEVRATIDGVALPVEERVFHGKVISISREIIDLGEQEPGRRPDRRRDPSTPRTRTTPTSRSARA